ncbi:Transition state regulatory protein AbrB [bioreactor metagenome]|uniref:Transition state regulatory protein AbrB n=1 Tax=bioreactor metagenome TaxID=1076179 RepID=A0A645H3R8_9ZZZZ|nr:AbrB/MazE/SpoVT family DNA-binding domain-containing protein [Oscillospiraceae bacterium]
MAAPIIRRIDDLGRIVIPIDIRKNMEIESGNELELVFQDNQIIIKKPRSKCRLCGSEKDLENIDGSLLCHKCINKIKSV